MAEQAGDEPTGDDLEAVASAVLTASRLLVAVSARSLAAVEDRVTLPQFRMLVVIAQGEATLVRLADRLGVNPSTAMRMVDRLSATRLVRREVNPNDRRETLVGLTPEGRRIVEEVTARRTAEITAILGRMPPEQRRALVVAMRAFSEAGGEPPAGGSSPLGWPDLPPA
ncbi:MarR family transcriptional regulator [Microbispora corallina]|uniref:Transcriptional regulator n=1 Tax=Microbispora corallina TaxID=83302 RepID=A0ABQ4G222_9ACTN|nr:MarR family transcriptional regulator [Microbispora corallina]GIH41084.1 transcriptional regulator [Microbispora corallina]